MSEVDLTTASRGQLIKLIGELQVENAELKRQLDDDEFFRGFFFPGLRMSVVVKPSFSVIEKHIRRTNLLRYVGRQVEIEFSPDATQREMEDRLYEACNIVTGHDGFTYYAERR